jgi:hypothetical protein
MSIGDIRYEFESDQLSDINALADMCGVQFNNATAKPIGVINNIAGHASHPSVAMESVRHAITEVEKEINKLFSAIAVVFSPPA